MPGVRSITERPLHPFWTDGATTYYLGDVIEVLQRLPARSVQCCVTSPPYWALRSYNVAADAKHAEIGSEPLPDCLGWATRNPCGKCFVCKIVAVFREVRRVLRDDGVCWINLGDSYASRTDGSDGGRDAAIDRLNGETREKYNSARQVGEKKPRPVAPGNLVGVPWRVALALQADGWVLRQDIIWSKPAPMPESVRNRCTKAHEYVFLFAKGKGYYYDAEAIKEEQKSVHSSDSFLPDSAKDSFGDRRQAAAGVSRANRSPDPITCGANKRSVWTVSGAGYSGKHYATFPEKLIAPMIKAGTSAVGACVKCGRGWERVIDRKFVGSYHSHGADGIEYGLRQGDGGRAAVYETPNTTGWRAACDCHGEQFISAGDLLLVDGPVPYTRSCIVLDPFIGAGTTALACKNLGRHCYGIDLSEMYLRGHAIPRVAGDSPPEGVG